MYDMCVHPGVAIDVSQNTKVITKQIKTSLVPVIFDIIVIYKYMTIPQKRI